MEEPVIYSVSQLTQYVKELIERDDTLAAVCVSGEISNFKRHSAGHLYLTLKDDKAVLHSVMFKWAADKVQFQPRDGMKIIAKGRISVFGGAGQYQLYITELQPDGIGSLYLAFEQLKAKLAQEGLFRPELKLPLPRYPRRICLITSPTGAAVRDMLRILKARYPLARVRILPVRVQGAEAPGEIVEALRFAGHHRLADLILLGRGGGSLEDLWAFNDEAVARAIVDCPIPVISAVGHEPDVTIADFAADLRAATPSNGAELAVPDKRQLQEALQNAGTRMEQSLKKGLQMRRESLRRMAEKRVLQSPEIYLQDRRMAWMQCTERLQLAGERDMERKREQFSREAARLDALSPLKVLGRGYAMAQDAESHVVTDAKKLEVGQTLRLTLAKGQALCRVEETICRKTKKN